ncbi:hypothetical protein BRADI_5g05948v3 [Brachypodium distachyon]|uniref:F-box domain-containing protein n=1 Tax=Brachypodium distachyon TaxID=15368 RepID=A0A0Q3E2U7_BRADI|nr:hypothetical protein BRADI_5g05948v3 [Brachypodium distachyon]
MEAGARCSKKLRSAGADNNGEAPVAVTTTGAAEDVDGIDLISELPDELLGEIIYLLPIKEGARTSILAHRWCHLWRSVPLNLDCRKLGWPFQQRRDFVAGLVRGYLGPVHRFITGQVDWIVAPPPRNDWLMSPAFDRLQELSFVFQRPRSDLPWRTFRFSPTLRVLKLKRCNLHDDTTQ